MARKSKITRAAGGRAQLQKPRARRWTRTLRARFLETLAATANVSASARAVGMCPQGAYKLRARDAAFAQAWQAALAQGYERLELMLLERALHGTDKEVWYRGEKVGTMRSYSDSLALSLLRAHRDSVKQAPAIEEPEILRKRLELRIAEMRDRLRGDDL